MEDLGSAVMSNQSNRYIRTYTQHIHTARTYTHIAHTPTMLCTTPTYVPHLPTHLRTHPPTCVCVYVWPTSSFVAAIINYRVTRKRKRNHRKCSLLVCIMHARSACGGVMWWCHVVVSCGACVCCTILNDRMGCMYVCMCVCMYVCITCMCDTDWLCTMCVFYW